MGGKISNDVSESAHRIQKLSIIQGRVSTKAVKEL